MYYTVHIVQSCYSVLPVTPSFQYVELNVSCFPFQDVVWCLNRAAHCSWRKKNERRLQIEKQYRCYLSLWKIRFTATMRRWVRTLVQNHIITLGIRSHRSSARRLAGHQKVPFRMSSFLYTFKPLALRLWQFRALCARTSVVGMAALARFIKQTIV